MVQISKEAKWPPALSKIQLIFLLKKSPGTISQFANFYYNEREKLDQILALESHRMGFLVIISLACMPLRSRSEISQEIAH